MKLLILAFLVIYPLTILAQKSNRCTISGYIREVQSSELLIGVNVFLPELKIGTTSNNYGFYSITLPSADSVDIVFTYVGFRREVRRINLKSNQELNISLTADQEIEEVTITSSRVEKQSESAKMSVINLPVAQIKNVPSLLGEKDVLKVIQLMPGVQKGSEGSSGIYVRGGGPDQNLIILDDAIVYNASHLFGFFSLFNGDALKSVELTKGGFPARYGGRLSSVLDMNMKEGNKEKWHGEGGIGLISSRLTLEGPLVKKKSSILLSGRRTYVDLFLRPSMNKEDGVGGYFFYDFNAKVNYDFGRNNKLYLSGYFGRDKFYVKSEDSNHKDNAGFFWGNATGTMRWNHLFSNKIFANTSLIYSSYKFKIYDKYKEIDENKDYNLEYYSGIQDFTFKYDVDYMPVPQHSVKTGIIATMHRFSPHAYIEEDKQMDTHIRDVKTTEGFESGIYLEDTWQPFNRLKFNGGARFTQFFSSSETYYFLEPRISAAFRLRNDMAFKASYAEMSQYIHMLSNTGISLPTDLWVPTTNKVKPQQSKQVAVGLAKDLSKPDLLVSLEGYYKKMHNIVGYKEGASFLILDDPSSDDEVNWEDNLTAGKGWSYGIEFLIQKKVGKFNGWIGYTLSWTQFQFDSLNFGRKFYPRYDRRHDISIVGIYKISERITLSGTWVYGTGNSLTMPISIYKVSEHQPLNAYNNYDYLMTVHDFGAKNSFRMAPYHRLDVGIQFHKKKPWGERVWEISVYNAYNRKNPFFYYASEDYQNGHNYTTLKQFSLFPIIPSITYSFNF